MEAFDKLPESVRRRLDGGKAGEIFPAQHLYGAVGEDEERAHKVLDDAERLHRQCFGSA